MKIRPRKPRFDLSDLPLHWVGGDPQTTHTVNTLSLLLPAGERWFVDLFKQALPLVDEPELRDALRGFIGQEANHAVAHDRVLAAFAEQGLDVRAFVAEIEWLFDTVLSDAPFGLRIPRRLERRWLRRRVALVAAIEHFTTMLGAWVVEAEPLARASRHHAMMELLLWHGAEEVEHRSVAFDLAEHLGSSYPERVTAMSLALAALTVLWVRGISSTMRQDPSKPGPATFSAFVQAGRRGLLPTPGHIAAAVGRYLRPSHHPSTEHEPEAALRVLAELSPPSRQVA